MPKGKEPENLLVFDYFKAVSYAFKTDCEDLLLAFDDLHSLKYEDFAAIWKEKGFTNVFAGFKYAVLIRYFCENCFYAIKKYIMFPRTQYTEIGAFYLLYGLYYKQPLKDFVKIRVTLEEFQQIVQLIDKMREIYQMDAVYIFNKMKTDCVFTYVATRKPLGPELRFIRDHENFFDDTFISQTGDATINKFGELASSSLVTGLEEVNSEYQELLKKYSSKNPNSGNFQSTIVEDLRSCWSDLNGIVDKSEEETCPKNEPTELEKVKDKAMKTKNAVYRANRSIVTGVGEFDISKKLHKC